MPQTYEKKIHEICTIFKENIHVPCGIQTKHENSNTGILESDSQAGSLSYYAYFYK
jgi:hypothetical protein